MVEHLRCILCFVNMKTIIIFTSVVAGLALLFILLQAFSTKSTEGIESRKYTVLKTVEEVEIRSYEPANYSYVTMPASSYKDVSSKGFRILAGYIFGGNDQGASIAMTSPVAMHMSDSITMKFMVPADWDLDELPDPNNSSIQFSAEGESTMAVLRFSGWANDDRIELHRKKLLATLDSNGISHSKEVSFFGYNPPYEVLNRRNEVAVEIFE